MLKKISGDFMIEMKMINELSKTLQKLSLCFH